MKNKRFLNLLFPVTIFFCLISFLWSFFCHQSEIELPYLGHLNADTRINVETSRGEEIFALINKDKISPYVMQTKNSYVSFETNGRPIYKLGLIVDDDAVSAIDNVALFIGKKLFYYTKDEILNFERDKDGAYLFPKDVKYYEGGGYITDRGILNRIAVALLSFFYNFQFYIFPWLWLILACFLYLKEKKPDFKTTIWWILILALLIRIQDNGFSFWSDELYTATFAGNPNLPFMTTFKDPGNPPLFFILARFWMMLFGNSESVCRILPTIFSLLSIYFTYIFVKQNSDEEGLNPYLTSLLAAFLLAINLYSIQSAREFRAYQLGAMLSILCAIYLFKIIKNNKNKDYWIYAVLGVLAANTHYFMVLFLVGNFFWGIFQIKQKWKFFIANCIGAAAFSFHFFYTSFKNAFLNPDFQSGLRVPTNLELWNAVSAFFDGKIMTIVVILITILFLLSKNKKSHTVYLYSAYTIFFLYSSSIAFSCIRPIYRSYYYVIIIPFAPVILSMLVSSLCKFHHKLLFSLLLLMIYFSGQNFFRKDNATLIRFDGIFQYAAADSLKYRQEGKKIGIALHDTPNYAQQYKQFLRGDEIFLMYEYLPTWDEMLPIILNSSADVIYMKFPGKSFALVCEIYSNYMDIALVRTEKDVLVARLVKKKAR